MSETHAVSQNASIWRAHTPRGARGWRAHTRTLRRGIAHAGGAGDTARGQERNPNSRAVACNDANPGLLFRAPPVPIAVLRRGGNILAFSALAWVLAHAVYAPGRITLHRLQGAIVLYLSLAMIFASVYGLIWELISGAFANIAVPTGDQQEVAVTLYFSLTTLTTTGYGDIVPVDPFARSLANLESVVGPLFLAITVARLVSMELADRRR